MPLNRREFMLQAGLTAAALGLVGCQRNNQTSDSASTVAAQQLQGVTGQPLRPPPQVAVQRQGGLALATLIASPTPAMIAGQRVQALTYNGHLPGPTLRVRADETLRLTFRNNLAPSAHSEAAHASHNTNQHGSIDGTSNLHLHGPHIAPEIDQPMHLVPPGHSRTIDLSLTEASAGTHWFHPHPHGQVGPQLLRGLSGNLIVEGELDRELQDWEEHLLVFKDFTLRNGTILGHQGSEARIGKPGELMTVNGQLQPVLHATKAGIRLRLLNQSTMRPYLLHLENHAFHLIATDGHTLEKPVQVEELLLAPGQRADVLVRLDGKKSFRLFSQPYQALTASTKGQLPLLTIQAPGGTAPQLPMKLANLERLKAADSVATRPLKFTFLSGFMGQNYRFMINGQQFDHARADMNAKLGTQETWEIENSHSWDLPFHLHSYPFQVAERRVNDTWVPEPLLGWRDTVNLQHKEAVRILIPFRHYAGKTVYHCHIVEHEDAGMMGIVNVT